MFYSQFFFSFYSHLYNKTTMGNYGGDPRFAKL